MTDQFRAMCDELAEAYAWCIEEYMTAPAEEDTLIQRARALLAQPEPVAPTDQEIEEWADACPEAPVEEMDPEIHGWRRCFTAKEFSETIRAAIARWGYPTPQPVAEGPTDEELLRLAREWNSGFESRLHFAADYARAVLAKWGRQ